MGWLRRWTLQLWTESIIVVRSTEVRGRWRTEHPASPPVARSRGVSQWRNILPRWEWRTFGESFGASERRFAALKPGGIQESDELYLLSPVANDNVKIRNLLMDIKALEQVNPDGLEQWKPVMKATFPLPAAEVRNVFKALRVAPPSLARADYTLGQFVGELAAPGVLSPSSRRAASGRGDPTNAGEWVGFYVFDESSWMIDDSGAPLYTQPPPARCAQFQQTNPNRFDFVSTNLLAAQTIALQLDTNPSNILGMSSLESNDGTSSLAQNYNNSFGLTRGHQVGLVHTRHRMDANLAFIPIRLPQLRVFFCDSFQGARVSGAWDATLKWSRVQR